MIKFLHNNRGLTLIEVLLTLVITAIVSTVIYSTFTTGIKLYQKIGIEGQLRDDADYIATMILNQFYENSPSFVENFENAGVKGVKLVRYKEKTVERYVIEDNIKLDKIILIYLKDNKFYIKNLRVDNLKNADNVNDLSEGDEMEISNDSSILTTIDGESSSINLDINSCRSNKNEAKCNHGTIKLIIAIGDENQNRSSFLKTKPMLLKSSFGY